MPCLANTYLVKPLQSNPSGLSPPSRYGLPRRANAVAVMPAAFVGIGLAGDAAGGVHPPGGGKGLGTAPSRDVQPEQTVIASTMVTVNHFV